MAGCKLGASLFSDGEAAEGAGGKSGASLSSGRDAPVLEGAGSKSGASLFDCGVGVAEVANN